jgi:hypothetical protein
MSDYLNNYSFDNFDEDISKSFLTKNSMYGILQTLVFLFIYIVIRSYYCSKNIDQPNEQGGGANENFINIIKGILVVLIASLPFIITNLLIPLVMTGKSQLEKLTLLKAIPYYITQTLIVVAYIYLLTIKDLPDDSTDWRKMFGKRLPQKLILLILFIILVTNICMHFIYKSIYENDSKEKSIQIQQCINKCNQLISVNEADKLDTCINKCS